jgi:hypothetical protein
MCFCFSQVDRVKKPIAEKTSLLSATDLLSAISCAVRNSGCLAFYPACEITHVPRGGSERWIGDSLSSHAGDLFF